MTRPGSTKYRKTTPRVALGVFFIQNFYEIMRSRQITAKWRDKRAGKVYGLIYHSRKKRDQRSRLRSKDVHARNRVPWKSSSLFRHDGFRITPVVLTPPILRNAASAWLSIYDHDRDSWPAVNARLYSHRSSHRSYHLFQPRLTYGNDPYSSVWSTELATNI